MSFCQVCGADLDTAAPAHSHHVERKPVVLFSSERDGKPARWVVYAKSIRVHLLLDGSVEVRNDKGDIVWQGGPEECR